MFRTLLNNIGCWFVLIAALCLILPSSARSALYELGDSGWTAAVDEGAMNVITDVFTGAAVVIRIEKTFEGEPDGLGLIAPLYLDFYKNREDAAGQIIINDEFITNNTSANWIDFHIELEVSVSDPEGGFSSVLIPSGDLFETVVLSGSDGHNGLPTRFDFSNGLVPNNPEDQDDFRPGYHSGAIIIIADPEMQVGQLIVLKEYPTIPEPTTLCWLVLGALVMIGRKRST